MHFTLQGVHTSYLRNECLGSLNLVHHLEFVEDSRDGGRPVAAVTATTTTPNSIHKMSAEKKMTRFLSTVDSFLGAQPERGGGGRGRGSHCHEGISLTCILAKMSR